MCVGLMEGCLRREGRGTVVQYGTRGLCLCSSFEKAENGMAWSCLGARVHRAKVLVGEFQDLHGLPVCVFVL